MAVTKSILKLTETDCIVKVAGNDDTAYISLKDDLTRVVTEVAEADGQNVVVTAITWTGDANTLITVDRNNTRTHTLQGISSAQIPLTGQSTVPDNTEAFGDFNVSISGQGELVMRLKKMGGYKLKIETGLYGQYDDPNAIGPLAIDGAPGPQGLNDVPVIGSGSYFATQSFDVSESGSPSPVDYYFDAIQNETSGLYRRTFVGNFSSSPGSGVDPFFCRQNNGYYGKADPFVGFGQQDLEDASNYTLEWTGWFKAPADGTYNFWADADDDMHVWIGQNALEGENYDGNQLVYTTNTLTKNNDSVTMLGGMYYPVRIQYGEFSGAEKAQVYWASTTDSVAYAGNVDGNPAVWFHNSVTKGI